MSNPKPYQPARPENEPLKRLVASTEQVSAAVAPLMSCAARANAEFLSLAARRSRAYLDIPRSLTACQSPLDLFTVQARFWQTMTQDYTDYARRVAGALEGLTERPESSKGTARDFLPLANGFGFPMWSLPVETVRDEQDRAA